MPIPPLKNLQFFLYGKLKDKEETKKRILKLGGLVVSKLTDTTVAVVSTKKDVERMPEKMEEIKSMGIEVGTNIIYLDFIFPFIYHIHVLCPQSTKPGPPCTRGN